MPTLREMFPSTYINGDDLGGKAFVLTISRVVVEKVYNEEKNQHQQKYVVYFDKAQKGVALGKTQAEQIFQVTGTVRCEDWRGKTVELYPVKGKAFGKAKVMVRFRRPTAAEAAAQTTPLPESMTKGVEVEEEEEEAPVDQENPLGARTE